MRRRRRRGVVDSYAFTWPFLTTGVSSEDGRRKWRIVTFTKVSCRKISTLGKYIADHLGYETLDEYVIESIRIFRKSNFREHLDRFPDVWVSPTLDEISDLIEEDHRMSPKVEAELRAVLIEKLAELEDWQKEALREEFRWYQKFFPDRKKHWWWYVLED